MPAFSHDPHDRCVNKVPGPPPTPARVSAQHWFTRLNNTSSQTAKMRNLQGLCSKEPPRYSIVSTHSESSPTIATLARTQRSRRWRGECLRSFYTSTVPRDTERAQVEFDAAHVCRLLPTFHTCPTFAMVKETNRGNAGPLGVAHLSTEDDWYEGMFIRRARIVSQTSTF